MNYVVTAVLYQSSPSAGRDTQHRKLGLSWFSRYVNTGVV